MSAGSKPGEGARYVVEQGRRLSESVIWQCQHSYYERQGDEALACMKQALAINPGLEPARQMLVMIEARLDRQAPWLDPRRPAGKAGNKKPASGG